jgi:hypothetical protein
MKKLLLVPAATFCVLFGRYLATPVTVHATAQTDLVRNPTTIAVPKSYGALRDVTLGVFIFEDANGTIRVVNAKTANVDEIVYRK